MGFLQKLRLIFKDTSLRNKIIFVIAILAVFRILASIPIPGVDDLALQTLFDGNQFLGLVNIFSGGGLTGISIMMLGVAPYITASIIMQVLTMISSRLKNLYHEEGAQGKKKFAQYSRMLSVPLAFLQGFGFLMLLERSGVLPNLSTFELITNLIVIVAGSVFLMWLGELITEFGIGNGVSLIIFAGIVAGFPDAIRQALFAYDPSQLPTYIAFIVVAVLITLGVVIITEAERPIPITYSKQARGTKVYGGTTTYLPLRINQAGVIPIIFALSILLLPQMLLNFVGAATSGFLLIVAQWIEAFLLNPVWYGVLYFVLVFAFTFFYTAVTFDPESIAKNLQKGGAFVPGIRPGQSTTHYIAQVVTRITLVGALFLGFIAVIPIIVQGISGITTLTIGGTSLLIAVSVIIDLIKKVESQLVMREY